MRTLLITAGCLLPALSFAQEDGWQSIFDGKTLEGWSGDPKFWSVQDGALTGKTTKENPTQGNTFAMWTGGKTGDFELKLKYKIVGGNSGIQYRSFKLKDGKDEWRVGGYQADIDSGDTYSGILYGEKFRGILANRGLVTELGEDGKPKTVGTLGDSHAIQAKIKKEEWNDYHIVAKGFHFKHFINGVQTSECTDNDTDTRRETGMLALQLHAGPPMVVQFKDIKIKQISAGGTSAAPKKDTTKVAEAPAKRKAPEPTDDVNEMILQILPNGGYILKTKPLTKDALSQVLGALSEVNPDASVRIQANKKSGQEHAKAARKALKDAGISVAKGRGKRKKN